MRLSFKKIQMSIPIIILAVIFYCVIFTGKKVLYFDLSTGKVKCSIEYLGISFRDCLSETEFYRILNEENMIQNQPSNWVVEYRSPLCSHLRDVPYLRTSDAEMFSAFIRHHQIHGELKKKMIIWELDRLKNFEDIRSGAIKTMGEFSGDNKSTQQFINSFL